MRNYYFDGLHVLIFSVTLCDSDFNEASEENMCNVAY